MSSGGAFRPSRAGPLMAGPALLLIFVFIILPFLLGLGFSLTNQRLASPNPTEYVGLANFRRMLGFGVLTLEPERDSETGEILRDAEGSPKYPRVRSLTRNNPNYPDIQGMRELVSWDSPDGSRTVIVASDVLFLRALRNTLVFVAVVAPLQGGLALLLALLVNQRIPGVNIFRAIYFMPVVISIIVVSLLWSFIYDGGNGVLNALLSAATFGAFEPVDWIGDPDTALGAIIAMSAWSAVGLFMVMWLGGMQSISPALYEAARLEGASRWQTFRFVTWPGLRNTAVLVLVVITMQAFALFSQIDVMTRGGPLDSTQTLVYQAVQRGYGKQDIAEGSAVSVVLFLLVLLVTAVQRRLTRDRTAAQ